MKPRTSKDDAKTVSFRQPLFVTTAIVTLVTATASMRPAHAQSVTGNGVNPGGIVSPHWSVGSDLQVGIPGGGTLNITGGGTVTNDTGIIGNGTLDQGTVTVSGHDASGNASTWTNNGDFVAGQNGNGTLIIQDGGKVSNADAYIGASTGSLGNVTVSGRDINGNASTWTSSGPMYVGDSGTGTLRIENGGVANGASALVGNSIGGVGSVTVSGRDLSGNASTWNLTNQLYVGAGGTGTLSVLDGGLVNSGQGLIAYDNGIIGSVTVSGRDINGNASTWNAANNIYVGFGGNGTLTIADGATVATRQTGGGRCNYLCRVHERQYRHGQCLKQYRQHLNLDCNRQN